MVQIRALGSTTHVGFRTPLAFLPLSGGGPESGAHLSNGSNRRARINDDEDHSGPPPAAFLPLSGGGGVQNSICIFPTTTIKAPGSTTLVQPRPS